MSLTAIVHSVGLAKLDIAHFDGNPLHYNPFIVGFGRNVADRLWGDTHRLSYVVQYCSGGTKEAVRYCLLMPEQKLFSGVNLADHMI